MSDLDVVERHYRRTDEEERLEDGVNQIERVRIEGMLERFLPDPPSVVRDVGGGPGRYAFQLAARDYEVHLFDLLDDHVERARQRSQSADEPALADARVGDARDLPWRAESSDAVLMLGPLYHLQSVEDRLQALEEAWRVLRPGGVLMAVAICRFASTLEGLVHGRLEDSTFAEIARQERETGRHDNPTGELDYFTQSYYHRPPELDDEVTEAGFDVDSILGIEGPAWLVSDFQDRWEDEDWRERFLEVARDVEGDPSIVGASAHLMAVARKPE